MYKPLEVYIGLRYTRAKRRNHFISFISFSSMLGIALGVTALITVLSVMNGFERELRERILGMASHATITGLDGTLTEWPQLLRKARRSAHVIGAAPYVRAEAMLTHRSLVKGALIRGISPEHEPEVAEVVKYVKAGKLEDLVPGKFNIILGAGLARRLGARLGSKVTLVAPQANVSPAGILPRLRRFTVTGIFEVNHGQYDGSLALVHMDDARRMFKLGDRISGLRLKLDDLFLAPRVSRQIATDLGGAYWVKDWTQHHANFFRALKTEKTVMFIILT
ncbi:MAG: ABC transporter permease, partial [Pseudomonadota bacterium]